MAQQDADASIEHLQSEMYRYFTTTDAERFFSVTDSLKLLCLEQGDERTFYKAWSNQAIYESARQRRTHGLQIAKEMQDYALQNDSKFGQYTSLHVMGGIYKTMADYEKAEELFARAADFLHQHFPEESASADYLELTNVSTARKQHDKARKYATLALNEQGAVPMHRLRALSLLCLLAADEGNMKEFNRLYEQRREVRRQTNADGLEPSVEVQHSLVNKRYQEALQRAAKMDAQSRALVTAQIYHAMGDNATAYQWMQHYRHISDSLASAKQETLLADYQQQLNIERMENENNALKMKNRQMAEEARQQQEQYRFITATILMVVLVVIIITGVFVIRRLRHHNAELNRARQAEQTARKEAERALDVKRDFLNNVSHEMRTPLNSIAGFSEILATPGLELPIEEKADMSQRIKENTQLLTGIIENMIELSRYESLNTLPKDDVLSPNVLGQQMVQDLEGNARPGVVLRFCTQLADDHMLHTNRQGVEKVLRHLLENSLKFTTEGSVVLGCTEGNGRVVFSVTDTGPGIAPERQAHVFELFAETNETVKTTGMGLSICHRIAGLLDAQISLDTAYTDGCRFVFALPLT